MTQQKIQQREHGRRQRAHQQDNRPPPERYVLRRSVISRRSVTLRRPLKLRRSLKLRRLARAAPDSLRRMQQSSIERFGMLTCTPRQRSNCSDVPCEVAQVSRSQEQLYTPTYWAPASLKPNRYDSWTEMWSPNCTRSQYQKVPHRPVQIFIHC
jgi:hypothetical protein